MTEKLSVLVSVLRGSGIKKDYLFDEKDELGNGRYGIVMHATDKKTKKAVAVKKMNKKGVDSDTLARMKREVDVMRMIKHENCIQFHKAYESKHSCYIVMELVTGGELLDRVIEKDHYTETEAANCFAQIIDAIKYLHSKRIVHRDLKPENILYANKSADSPIKIADYGLAALIAEDTEGPPAKRGRLFTKCGSPSFVAPEVLAGKGYGRECDVWSVGCILYILLCGFMPFDQEDDEVEVLTGRRMPTPVSTKVDFPMPYWEAISEEAKDLVGQMLSLDPDERPKALDICDHKWLQKRRQNALPKMDLTDLQSRLRQMRMNTVIGAIHSLTALNKMRSKVDWEVLHQNLIREAEHRLDALKLEPERLSALKEGFNMLDRDRSGRISLQNLRDAVHAMGKYKDEEDLMQMMKNFDVYQTGDITFEEYCIMMSPSPSKLERQLMRKGSLQGLRNDDSSVDLSQDLDGGAFPTYEEELHAAFFDLDTDSSGHIDPQNLKEVMHRFGTQLTDEEAREMIRLADTRGDGVIHKDEFIDFIAAHMLSPQPASASSFHTISGSSTSASPKHAPSPQSGPSSTASPVSSPALKKTPAKQPAPPIEKAPTL
mmetsp:Transcript_27633/g.68308  ORF Transcript_27633/g.68308 Transcript_27633/m.68308 type:complete len:602 (-) Transcript_27633:8-1813(-)